jgi:hypothetical protein
MWINKEFVVRSSDSEPIRWVSRDVWFSRLAIRRFFLCCPVLGNCSCRKLRLLVIVFNGFIEKKIKSNFKYRKYILGSSSRFNTVVKQKQFSKILINLAFNSHLTFFWQNKNIWIGLRYVDYVYMTLWERCMTWIFSLLTNSNFKNLNIQSEN